MSWNEGLNDDQKLAASYTGTHACLLAGPGTGKTTCITRRILYLINELETPACAILVLTFTRAAASELRARIRDELGEDSELPQVYTLHSFALRTILSEFAGTRLPQPIRIADDYEERRIIQEDLKEILPNYDIKKIRELFNRLSADWEKLSADHPDWEQRFPDPTFLGTWREHRKIFGYILRSELVYQLKLALNESGVNISNDIKYLLVDEYQDLNPCDLAVTKSMTRNQTELYAAGDDDQSIYGFRYADPEGIRQFSNYYEQAKNLDLKDCIRCDSNILQLGLYVAEQDARRISKQLQCSSTEGGEVRILHFSDQTYEASGITKLCKWLINSKDIQAEEILILIRSDRHQQFSSPIRNALLANEIPVRTMSNPLAPLEEPEGRRFLSLLKLRVNREDHLAWRTLLLLKRGIGSVSISKLYNIARSNGFSFTNSIHSLNEDPTLITPGGEKIKEEFNKSLDIINNISDEQLSDLTNFIRTFTEEVIPNTDIRTQILDIFLKILDQGEFENLDSLLKAINNSLDEKEQEKDTGSVNIMTMHQAKGLSADVTIIVAAEDEYIPGRATGDQIGDERRLLYVSLTRARHFLYITHCQKRIGRQKHSGRASGSELRHLTEFLSGGPILSQSGVSFTQNLL